MSSEPDAIPEGVSLVEQAEAALRRGDPATTVRLVEQSLGGDDTPASETTVRGQWLLAHVHHLLCDYTTALRHVTLALTGCDTGTPMQLRSRVLLKGADLFLELDDTDQASQWLDQAEESAAGHSQVHLWVVGKRARAGLRRNDLAEAERQVARLHQLSDTYGEPLPPILLNTVATVQLAGDDVRGALHTVTRAQNPADQHHLPAVLLTLAKAQHLAGLLDEAVVTLSRARSACRDGNQSTCQAQILAEQADVYAAQGRWKESYECSEEAYQAARDLLKREREMQAAVRENLHHTAAARESASRSRDEARRDPLTGAFNRLYISEELPRLLIERQALSVALIDLDHFKSVNDTYSHDVGDEVLRAVVGSIQATLQATLQATFQEKRQGSPLSGASFLARLGGEELLLVLVSPDPRLAYDLVEQARSAVQDRDWSDLTPGRIVTFSAGLATALPGDTQQQLLRRADAHLYRAKETGRNRVQAGDLTAHIW